MRRKFFIKVGDRFGDYLVIDQVPFTTSSGSKEKRWVCKHSVTGKIIKTRSNHLASFLTEDEIASISKPEGYQSNGKHQMGLRAHLYREYRGNARKRGILFELDFNSFDSLITSNCSYCGEKPTNSTRASRRIHKGQPPLYYNGVDRINSNLGYSVNNCVPCCSKCNLMKNVFSTEEFISHIHKIYRFTEYSSTTIPKGSTTQANGVGKGDLPIK